MSTVKTDKIEGYTNSDIVEIPTGVSGVYLADLYNKSYESDNIITPYDIISKGPALDPRVYGTLFNSATLATAIASVGSNQRTIIIPTGVWSISGSLTFPTNICVWFVNGGMFDVSGSVTFLGPVLAGNYQIFTGSGSVAISSTTPLTYDAWNGTAGNGITFQTIPVLPSTPPSNARHAVNKAYVDSLASAPSGVVYAYGGATPPTGYLLCDGTVYTSASYPSLSVILQDRYGGSWPTTFAVPDARGRVIAGLSGATYFAALGDTGGTSTVTLNQWQITRGAVGNSFNVGPLSCETLTDQTAQPHNNLQPYIVLNYIIKT